MLTKLVISLHPNYALECCYKRSKCHKIKAQVEAGMALTTRITHNTNSTLKILTEHGSFSLNFQNKKKP